MKNTSAWRPVLVTISMVGVCLAPPELFADYCGNGNRFKYEYMGILTQPGQNEKEVMANPILRYADGNLELQGVVVTLKRIDDEYTKLTVTWGNLRPVASILGHFWVRITDKDGNIPKLSDVQGKYKNAKPCSNPLEIRQWNCTKNNIDKRAGGISETCTFRNAKGTDLFNSATRAYIGVEGRYQN